MDILALLKANLNKRLEVLTRSLEQAKIAQRNAPSAMESHSDTTRSEMEKMVTALEIEIAQLKKNQNSIPVNLPTDTTHVALWQLVTLRNAGQSMEVVIVPDGLGGSTLEGIKVISENTPLALIVKGKQVGDRMKLGEAEIEIMAIN